MRKILIALACMIPAAWLIAHFQLKLAVSLAVIVLFLFLAMLLSTKNEPGEMKFIRYVITTSPQKARSGERFYLCYERSAGEVIMDLAAKAENRRYGRELGPVIYVRFDCGDFYNHWDYDHRLNLLWLVNNGRWAGIYVSGVGDVETR